MSILKQRRRAQKFRLPRQWVAFPTPHGGWGRVIAVLPTALTVVCR